MKLQIASIVLVTWYALVQAAHAEKPAPTTSARSANAFFAFCMDTHDSKKRTLEQQAELLKELGYAGAGHLWLGNVEERIETLDEAGLKLFQVYLRVNIAQNSQPYDRRLADVMPLLENRDVMLALLVGGLAPSDTAGDPRAVTIVREIADIARDANVRVVLYPHTGDWVERVEDAVRIARKAGRPNVGVMFNLCHWLKVDGGENMKALLASAMPYLFAVSINGADNAADIHAGTGNWVQPLDSGSFDVYALLQALQDLGYKGPVGLQCYGIPGDARDHLTRSMAAWRKFVERMATPTPP